MKNYEIEFENEVYYLPQLDTKTVDKKRYYITPEGKEYPSITTVLSPRNKAGIMKWRKKVGDDKYSVEMALAGYKKDEIKVKVEDNVLSITGSSEDEDGDFVHKGIAKRSFRKQLQLQEYVECKGAKLEDGMLKINLEYNPPEEKKAKIIDVD